VPGKGAASRLLGNGRPNGGFVIRRTDPTDLPCGTPGSTPRWPASLCAVTDRFGGLVLSEPSFASLTDASLILSLEPRCHPGIVGHRLHGNM
jgi:hypothetical protein